MNLEILIHHIREDTVKILLCSCPFGFAGVHCEVDQSVITQPCILGCMNGGVCALGFRASTPIEKLYNKSSDPNDFENYQHCQCLTGFSGLLCKIPYKTCSDKVHCFHGGRFVSSTDENGLQDFSCDCSNAKDELSRYYGPSCQIQSTPVTSPIATTPTADTPIVINPNITTPAATGPIVTTPTVPVPTGFSPSTNDQVIAEPPVTEGDTIAPSSEFTMSSDKRSMMSRGKQGGKQVSKKSKKEKEKGPKETEKLHKHKIGKKGKGNI